MSWEADGWVRFWNELVPVSNCADCMRNLRVALDSAQRLPQWEWRSWAEVRLWQCNWRSWSLFGCSSTWSGLEGVKYDLKLVATQVVLPKMLLLLHCALLVLSWLDNSKYSFRVAFFLLPLCPLAIGGTWEKMHLHLPISAIEQLLALVGVSLWVGGRFD